jgi:hypothetical protein
VALPEVTPVAALDDPAVWLPVDPAVSDALADPVAGCEALSALLVGALV